MSRPWTREWFEDCKYWWDRVLEGRYSHWCETTGLPIDETCGNVFKVCHCFDCKCGRRMVYHSQYVGTNWGYRLDEEFRCPEFRWWKFWRHDWRLA